MKINWKVRFKNPVFYTQLILSILVPIIGYMGIRFEDLTTWVVLGDVLVQALSNPYVVALVLVSVWNALNDPTTKGLSDSIQARNYKKPRGDVE
ncbi:phage holin [Paucisalibacillus globulus]|uniref:phage holin n=1 Tax=Paucisalibacillus globulus TaxID=351095 RepID=UPI000BB8CE84|nr:phage holin [Paucisalibacillus globulus]